MKIDSEISRLNSACGDELLCFSAYHSWRVIVEHNEQLASAQFTNISNCKLVHSAQLANWLIVIKTYKEDYFGA